MIWCVRAGSVYPIFERMPTSAVHSAQAGGAVAVLHLPQQQLLHVIKLDLSVSMVAVVRDSCFAAGCIDGNIRRALASLCLAHAACEPTCRRSTRLSSESTAISG